MSSDRVIWVYLTRARTNQHSRLWGSKRYSIVIELWMMQEYSSCFTSRNDYMLASYNQFLVKQISRYHLQLVRGLGSGYCWIQERLQLITIVVHLTDK